MSPKRDLPQVEPYSIQKLVELLSLNTKSIDAIVQSKSHIGYFQEYFHQLDAKTIVVEPDYVDRYYMEDFAGYYSRCFDNYDRLCCRLHFFDEEFGEDDFRKFILGTVPKITQKPFDECYLGFVVTKPLPVTVIGRTCLRHYDTKNTSRQYPIVRQYPVHLFGQELLLKTLAFQEQDCAVGACATSALWSLFQGTGMIFQHEIPSPFAITKMAGSVIADASLRLMPNNGLTPRQIAGAIRGVGLEANAVNLFQPSFHEFLLTSNTYSYLMAKIPVILGVILVDLSGGTPKIIGKHAVTVTGFRLDNGPTTCRVMQTGFSLRASRINKIYVHDDQVGPFARMVLGNHLILPFQNRQEQFPSLSTSWPGRAGVVGNVVAVPDVLIIPLYHKIRISFEKIIACPIHFNELLSNAIAAKVLKISAPIEWDIYLTKVTDFKQRIRANFELPEEERSELLLTSMPLYMWTASIYSGDKLLLELLFDATDVDFRSSFLRAVSHDPQFVSFLGPVCARIYANIQNERQFAPITKIIRYFADRI